VWYAPPQIKILQANVKTRSCIDGHAWRYLEDTVIHMYESYDAGPHRNKQFGGQTIRLEPKELPLLKHRTTDALTYCAGWTNQLGITVWCSNMARACCTTPVGIVWNHTGMPGMATDMPTGSKATPLQGCPAGAGMGVW